MSRVARLWTSVRLKLGFALFTLGVCLTPAIAQTPDAPPIESPAAELVPAETPASEAAASGPSEVRIGAYINDIQSLDLQNYSFVADVYVWFRDSDPELVPGQTFEWMNMFAPEEHVQTAIYDTPQAQPDGSEYQLFRHQGPFSAKFYIRTYPFDAHKLTVEIEDQEWGADRLIYVADEIVMNPEIRLPGFMLGHPELTIENRPYATAFGDLSSPEPIPYSRAIISIPVSRPALSGITKSLVPVFIVVLVAAAALLLKPSHVEARVGLSITALLTLVALQFSATANLPEVGYLLLLDQIYLASYCFVLLVVALLVLGTARVDRAREAIDPVAAVGRGGPITAFLTVALYAAVIAAVLYFNLRAP